jgi:Zn-dependent protease with chaperone function
MANPASPLSAPARPAERRHFLDEQRRNRRRSRRFSVVGVIAVAVAGIPLGAVVSPLLLGSLLLAAYVADLVAPLPPEQWESLRRTALALPEIWNAVRGRPADVPWGTLAVLLLAPGSLLMLLAWPVVRRLSRAAGAGTILRRLPSREPDFAALAEQQLANVVQEMAVAAGVPVPAVRIIESPAVNIVAIGLTTGDATILATEGFLARMNRDERQAMVAHLVGSVGNGDLEIAAVVLSVIETWGLVTAMLESVLWRRQRQLVRDFSAAAARSLRGTLRPGEAESVIERLLVAEPADPMEVAMGYQPSSCLGVLYGVLVLGPLLATIGIASITARHASALFITIGFGPWLAAMWRARRRLADATAIQLTRNPEALAGAVRKLGDSDIAVPGGWPVNFLFMAWVGIEEGNVDQAVGAGQIIGMRLETAPRLEHLETLGATGAAGPALPLRARLRRDLGSPRELAFAVSMGLLGIVMSGVLLGASLAMAMGMLLLFWKLLAWVFLNPAGRPPS